MNYIGIDIGTSNIKIIETDEQLYIKNKATFEGLDPNASLDKFIENYHIDIKKTDKIIVTGIGANKLKKTYKNKNVECVSEFIAIGMGAKFILKEDNYISVSIGTGTAFVKNKDGNLMHIGGTGIGGGTLKNICNRIDKNFTFDKIENITKNCNLKKVDLWIEDVTDEEIKTLPKNITAVNLGRINEETKNEDLILGFVNMVFETIGVMAAFVAKGEKIKKIVILGKLAKIPFARTVLDKIEILHDVKFIIAEDPEYMIALGAIYSCIF